MAKAKAKKPILEKDIEVLAMHHHGIAVDAIAAKVGLSPHTVQMIVTLGPRWRTKRQMVDATAEFMPTADEIAEGCRKIQEDGYVDHKGKFHKPWTAAHAESRLQTPRQRRNIFARFISAHSSRGTVYCEWAG